MKKAIFLLALAFGAGGTAAEAQESLVVYNAAGAEAQSFALTDIVKITLGDDDVTVVTSGSKASTFKYDDVRSIKFSNLTTGITPAQITGSDLKLYLRNGMIGAENAVKPAKAMIFDLSGRAVMTRDGWDGTPFSVASLAKGVYILKVNNNTLKFTRQ